MSAWYYIGNDPTFNSNMDIAEMSVNFHTSDDVRDAKILYKYYVSRIEHYWIQIEMSLSFETLKEYKEYYSNIPKHLSERYDDVITETFDKLKILKSRFDEAKDKYNEKMKKLKAAYKKLIPSYNEGSLSKEKETFISIVMDIFYYISQLLCGDFEKKKEVKFSGYPLPNDTGLFSYNTYTYALTFGVMLVGIPTKVSDYDAVVNCPSVFVDHDLDHNNAMKKIKGNEYFPSYYEEIMRGNYAVEQKKAAIFALWYVKHELIRDVSYISVTYVSRHRLLDEGMFGITLDKEYWKDVRETLQYISEDPEMEFYDFNWSRVLASIDYIDGIEYNLQDNPETRDDINTTMMLIYGTSLIEKIHHKYGVIPVQN